MPFDPGSALRLIAARIQAPRTDLPPSGKTRSSGFSRFGRAAAAFRRSLPWLRHHLTPSVAVATLLALPSSSAAQMSTSLTGSITDETGAAIPTATIVIRQDSTGLEWRSLVNGAGR